jgi:acyl-CoA reductase-like NAD-dependent aldehyde dehydrogenase
MDMSQEHKEALALGRNEARAIKAYLKAVDGRRRGRAVSRETLEKRLARVSDKINGEADPLKRLELIQSRLEIQEALTEVEESANLEELEAGFVQYAKSYSGRKGVSYTAWREYGVPAATLRAAGVTETRRH